MVCPFAVAQVKVSNVLTCLCEEFLNPHVSERKARSYLEALVVVQMVWVQLHKPSKFIMALQLNLDYFPLPEN
jgi:hypothetical protein